MIARFILLCGKTTWNILIGLKESAMDLAYFKFHIYLFFFFTSNRLFQWLIMIWVVAMYNIIIGHWTWSLMSCIVFFSFSYFFYLNNNFLLFPCFKIVIIIHSRAEMFFSFWTTYMVIAFKICVRALNLNSYTLLKSIEYSTILFIIICCCFFYYSLPLSVASSIHIIKLCCCCKKP